MPGQQARREMECRHCRQGRESAVALYGPLARARLWNNNTEKIKTKERQEREKREREREMRNEKRKRERVTPK